MGKMQDMWSTDGKGWMGGMGRIGMISAGSLGGRRWWRRHSEGHEPQGRKEVVAGRGWNLGGFGSLNSNLKSKIRDIPFENFPKKRMNSENPHLWDCFVGSLCFGYDLETWNASMKMMRTCAVCRLCHGGTVGGLGQDDLDDSLLTPGQELLGMFFRGLLFSSNKMHPKMPNIMAGQPTPPSFLKQNEFGGATLGVWKQRNGWRFSVLLCRTVPSAWKWLLPEADKAGPRFRCWTKNRWILPPKWMVKIME